MNSLTIKAKLMGAFGALLLVILIMAGVASERIGVLNSEAAVVRDNWLPSVGAIGD